MFVVFADNLILHACMLQKGAIPRKLNPRKLSKGTSAKIYTLEIYPLYGMCSWAVTPCSLPIIMVTPRSLSIITRMISDIKIMDSRKKQVSVALERA